MRPATSGRWIQLRPRVRGTDGSGPETRDNRSKRPRRKIFGGAVKAQQSCATFKDQNTRVQGRVRGAMGKKKGRLKVLSSLGHVFEVLVNPASGVATWTDRSAGLGDQPITGVAFDARNGRLYAATDFGVAVLPRNAASWLTSAAGKLPPVAVYGLTIDSGSRVLYAATHGRGVWRLDLSDVDK